MARVMPRRFCISRQSARSAVLMDLQSRRRKHATRKKPPAVRKLKSSTPTNQSSTRVVRRLPETKLDWVLVAIRCEARFTAWTMTGTEFCAEAFETGDDSRRAKYVNTGAAAMASKAPTANA